MTTYKKIDSDECLYETIDVKVLRSDDGKIEKEDLLKCMEDEGKFNKDASEGFVTIDYNSFGSIL